MAQTVLEMGTLFPEKLVTDVFGKVAGKSSLAKLSQQIPLAFVGNKLMTFSMDDEVNLVGESEQKSYANPTVASTSIVPVKVEYGFRVSNEFLYATEEEKIDILSRFSEGFANKVARGLDIMAMHGVNPRTGESASALADKNFDSLSTQTVTTTSGKEDEDITSAIALFDASDKYDVNGLAMAKAYRTALGKLKVSDTSNMALFPELTWGAEIESLNGLKADVNSTVSFNSSSDLALIGDFDYFKWGYAKEVPMEVIPYGDPDGQGDLKRHNQVFIRAEAYIGWGILDGEAFARIVGA